QVKAGAAQDRLRRRLRPGDARLMLATGTIFLQTTNFINVCYIAAFGLMIYGLMGLTGPRTAVRGNKIAAAGMAVAVIATLLRKGEFHDSTTVWLILVGVVIG